MTVRTNFVWSDRDTSGIGRISCEVGGGKATARGEHGIIIKAASVGGLVFWFVVVPLLGQWARWFPDNFFIIHKKTKIIEDVRKRELLAQ
ncbi:hypothetical protein [Pasteuria penetrans]|uniref:hypothetical protein n=1 Tax=Pasteuria penetrans TaxID=86005 RepID=UPI0011ECF250|nr:hypothetical protein [Pasteuria penetrans]